jgi:hypothetical protein
MPRLPYHLKWWQLPTGSLTAGSYRLQITTTKVQLPPVGQSGFGGGNQPKSRGYLAVTKPTIASTRPAASGWLASA